MLDYGQGIVMKLYRVERFFYTYKMKILAKIMYYLIQILFNCVIPPSVEIGKGTCIAHGVGIVIHHDTKIGERCKIYQNVTIGNPGVIVGNECLLGAGAVLLGPCKIGNHAKVGANTVVNYDVPEYCTAVGIKSKIIMRGNKE